MTIALIEGKEKIDEALMAAMQATVNTLAAEGLLTEGQADQFLCTHICQHVDEHSGFKAWIDRVWNKQGGAFHAQVRVFKDTQIAHKVFPEVAP